MSIHVWVRAGDADGYNRFDDLAEAAENLANSVSITSSAAEGTA